MPGARAGYRRHGHYPESLDQLEFTGEWFPIFSNPRLKDGYQIIVTDEMAGELEYPEAFFSGVGLARTNVGRVPQAP